MNQQCPLRGVKEGMLRRPQIGQSAVVWRRRYVERLVRRSGEGACRSRVIPNPADVVARVPVAPVQNLVRFRKQTCVHESYRRASGDLFPLAAIQTLAMLG